MVTIDRVFAHRTLGEIGQLAMEADVKSIKIDGKVLPDASVQYLLHFALQSLQDAYAGAKSQAEAEGLWKKKLAALVEGTIGVRTGSGVDERTHVTRMIVRQHAKATLGAKSPEWAKFTGLADDKQDDKLDEWYVANKAAFDPAINAEMKRRADKRATKVAGVEFTL